jgi:hypothetical protein
MKKLYLSSSLLFIGFLSQAQFSKGTVLLGGDINFQSSTDKLTVDNAPQAGTTSKQTNISLQPSVGKAIQDNLVLGFGLDFAYSAVPNPGSNQYQYNEYGAEIFLRKYKELGNRFYLFGESNLGFDYSDLQFDYQPSNEPFSTEIKGYAINLVFTPGIAYAVSHKWQVEIELPSLLYASYGQSKENDLYTGMPDQHRSTKGFDFGSGLSTTTIYLALGLHYVIGGK